MAFGSGDGRGAVFNGQLLIKTGSTYRFHKQTSSVRTVHLAFQLLQGDA